MIPTYQASFSQYRDKRLAPPKQNKIQCSGGRLAQYESSNVAADVSPRRKFQCSGGRLARLLVRPEGDSRQRFLHLYPLTEVCYKPNIEHTIPLSANSSALEARSKTAAHLPAPAYEQQEAIFSQAFDLI